MANLADFLKTGSLGPLSLGLDPFYVTNLLGEPEHESSKKNPLVLEYGSLQLVFWKNEHKSQLRNITLSFIPEFNPLPAVVAFNDFRFKNKPTQKDFKEFTYQLRYLPTHITERSDGWTYSYLSGVTADITDGLLDKISFNQREKRVNANILLSDTREPTAEQIHEMINESIEALKLTRARSALVMAWAALEASLRRTAIKQGMDGKIGVQPSILIRELFAASLLSKSDRKLLENLRQLRTVVVHGLAPVEIPANDIMKGLKIADRLLKLQHHENAL